MNYASHYDRLIARARNRVLDGYKERHHVLPRCMGGTDAADNLVDLTPEEHYVAHQLLVRMHPGHNGIAYAAVKMSLQSSGKRPYGWLRRRLAESMIGSQRRLGMKHTSEARAKMSSSRKGKPITAAQRKAREGRKLSAEHKARVGMAGRGRVFSKESIAKRVAKLQGRKHSAAHCAKLREAWTRRDRTVSAEVRAKMSAALTGKKYGPMPKERREKLSAAIRAWWASGKGRNQWTTRSS